MYRAIDTYKNIFGVTDECFKEIHDRIDYLQRSQVYVHNHIDSVEARINAKIDELKKYSLLRLSDDEVCLSES